MAPTVITGMMVKDIRFPTSLEKHGSDAMVGIHYDMSLCMTKLHVGPSKTEAWRSEDRSDPGSLGLDSIYIILSCVM